MTEKAQPSPYQVDIHVADVLVFLQTGPLEKEFRQVMLTREDYQNLLFFLQTQTKAIKSEIDQATGLLRKLSVPINPKTKCSVIDYKASFTPEEIAKMAP